MGRFYYGGQAVLEGVMMRGRKSMAIACRRQDGQIVIRQEALTDREGRITKLPFVRGVFLLWDTLVLGTRAIMFSASVAMEEQEEELSPRAMWTTMAIALVFVVGLFFVSPLLFMNWLDHYLTSSFASNLIEGVIRLAVLLGYMAVIGLLPDIRRVFAYHGAEHKAVNAYESGAELEVGSVSRHSAAHTRCGTAFLLVVVVVSILVFAVLGRPPMWLRVISRIALVPVIAAVGYELLRFSAAHVGNAVVRTIFSPSLMLQNLTTREPDESQIEVAITALKTVLEADGVLETAAAGAAD